jgi:tripartite-type tricarboxylate transporter receptor subunit TctC
MATRVVGMAGLRLGRGLRDLTVAAGGGKGCAVVQEDSMVRRFVFALAGVFTLAGAVAAEQWPTRPVSMVIPFAAGGPTDVLGRVVGQRLSGILGQQVVIENVGGAGGMTGAQRVAQGTPDGYQIVLGTVGTHAQNQTLYKKPLYNAVSDFDPIVLIADVPLVLIARKDLPADTLPAFIAYAKANEAKMTFGSAGSGSATHLGCVLLGTAMGTNIVHVPYRGTGPAMQDLAAGRIDFLCEVISTALPQIHGGTVKAIATLTKNRSPVLPDLATAQEQGLAGFEAYTWNALFVPHGTPADIVKRLHDATVEAMDTPSVKTRLEGLGAVLVAPERRSSAYLGGFVKSEIEKWALPIKASGVSAD